MTKIFKFVSLLFCVFLSGCLTSGSMFVLMPDRDGKVGSITIENEAGSSTASSAGEAIFVSAPDAAPTPPKAMDTAQIKRVFDDALEAHPQAPEVYALYFESDSIALTRESFKLISGILSSIDQKKSLDISINGHSDRQGSDQYNMRLSMRRAKAVLRLLEDRGVDSSILHYDYHGEGDPLIPTADNVAEPRNRRAEVVIR